MAELDMSTPVVVDEERRASLTTAGRRLSGYVYGTVVAIAAVGASAKLDPHDAGEATALVASTAALLWLAHVYAHSLGESVVQDERLRWAELREIAWRELSIIEAAAPLVGALCLGTVGLISEHSAVWLAFALGLGMLGLQGLRFARSERLGVLATLVVVVANCSFAAALVWLKVLVLH